ncbi:MAG: hypothetical protein IJG68_04515 [Bacilli bacterium]|nr:hypothetical protein [Bacilli bacterium]
MVSGESIKNVLDNYTDLLRTYQSQLTNLTTWQGTSRNQLDMKVTNFLEEYNNIIGNQIASYANACELYPKYIEAKNQLNTNINNYNEAVRIKDNRSAQSFSNNINTLTPSVNNLKNQIESYLNSAASTKLAAPKLESTVNTTTSVGLSNSNKTLIPEVQQFLEQNRGKTVEIPSNIRKALGLKCEGLLSIPKNYDASKAYPFLLWLVGTGHAGGDVNNLKTANFAKSLVSGRYQNDDALIYIPCRWGNGDQNNSKYNASMLDNDLTNMVNGLNVDPNRISGAGSSVGAFAIAYLTTSHPNLFSTVAMTGGGYGGSLNNGIKVSKAIEGSPNTTYIWYVANNDETSKEYVNGSYCGNGVHTYTLQQHQQLQNAGINSIYYELGNSLGHENAVDRFPTRALLYDLTHITKGQRFNNLPGSVQHVTGNQSADAALDSLDRQNTYYIQLAV